MLETAKVTKKVYEVHSSVFTIFTQEHLFPFVRNKSSIFYYEITDFCSKKEYACYSIKNPRSSRTCKWAPDPQLSFCLLHSHIAAVQSCPPPRLQCWIRCCTNLYCVDYWTLDCSPRDFLIKQSFHFMKEYPYSRYFAAEPHTSTNCFLNLPNK